MKQIKQFFLEGEGPALKDDLNIVPAEAVTQRRPVRCVLKYSQNSQENNCARISFLIKLQQASACNFIKKVPLASVSFSEFCEIFKNTLIYRAPLVAASLFAL